MFYGLLEKFTLEQESPKEKKQSIFLKDLGIHSHSSPLKRAEWGGGRGGPWDHTFLFKPNNSFLSFVPF